MEVKPLEIYSEASNYGIVRMPGRKYPGCVMQGDSLAILFKTARRVAAAVQKLATDDEELLGDLDNLCRSLLNRLLHYQKVLQQEGFDLPYAWPVSREDAIWLMPQVDHEDEHQP